MHFSAVAVAVAVAIAVAVIAAAGKAFAIMANILFNVERAFQLTRLGVTVKNLHIASGCPHIG